MYRVNNGVPNQFTMDLNPFSIQGRTRYEAAYAQDQWTVEAADDAGRAPLRARVELLSRNSRSGR